MGIEDENEDDDEDECRVRTAGAGEGKTAQSNASHGTARSAPPVDATARAAETRRR
jgi:hypothetical protein